MKYRIQFSGIVDNTDANAILNEVESIKTDVYEADHYTPVHIKRITKKCKNQDEEVVYSSVDFDVSQETHSGTPTGETDFKIDVDISFTVLQDCYDFLNYIEGIKSDVTDGNCRWFSCRHEEMTTPLPKDGSYSYIDFDGEVIEHPQEI